MKITWNWLADYIDLTGLSPERMAEDLTNAGIPVEWMERLAPGVSGVVVGRVLAVEPHPNADRLRVCRVDAGRGDAVTVVCGASNVAAGQHVPLALPGAALPGGRIGRSELRGIVSEGMICSAGELGLNVRLLPKDMTSGILVLPDGAPVGQSINDYLGLDDMVLELELTPNRSDCLSLRGVAYEVGALYGRAVTMPELPPQVDRSPEDGGFPLTVESRTDLCGAIHGQLVTGLTLMPSPVWMQMRLLAVGVRPISNLVDITNYVMYEWGQPLHAYDYDKLEGHALVARQARAGETLTTLDGQTRTLAPEMIVIGDARRTVGLAGVMGGLDTEVTAATRTVVIESAQFDPLTVRRAGKAFGLRSEALLRFERGVDPAVLPLALARAADLMARFGGGRPVGRPMRAGRMPAAPGAAGTERRIVIAPARVSAVLGYDVTIDELLQVCARLDFPAGFEAGQLTVDVPSRRMDVTMQDDMIEEFARLLGYDRIPATMLEGVLTPGHLTRSQALRRTVREHLMDIGLQEVWTYTLTSPDAVARLRIGADHPLGDAVALANPLSEERTVLRTTMLVSLLETATYNANRQMADQRLFEIGTVFHRSPSVREQPFEVLHVAGLIAGRAEPESPHGAREFDFYDAKGIVESLLERVGILSAGRWERAREPYFHGGQAAELTIDGRTVARAGKLHDAVASAHGLRDACYFEADWDALLALCTNTVRVEPLPRHPASERDLALVVARELPAADLLATVRAAAAPLLTEVRVFDVYLGEKVGPGEKSLALRMTLRAPDRTLTDEEIQGVSDAVVRAAALAHGARLRD